jgi:hypothetical protein
VTYDVSGLVTARIRRLHGLPGGRHLLAHSNAWVLLAVIVVLVALAIYTNRRGR